MTNNDKPVANPSVVLREEFDDWAVLFDLDTGHGFGLNPTGVYVWKLLDGEHSISDMLKALHQDALDVPEEAGEHLFVLVEALTQQGLATYEAEQVQDYGGCRRPCPVCAPENLPDAMQFIYEPPRLVNLSQDVRADGTCFDCTDGSAAVSACTTGGGAVGVCSWYGQAPIHGNAGDCTDGNYHACDCNTGWWAGGYCNPTGHWPSH